MNVSVELLLAQMVSGLNATVAVGSITVSVMDCVSGLVQLGEPAVVMLTNVTVVFTV